MVGNLSVENTLTVDPMDCILFPNPNRGGFTITYNSKAQEQVNVTVADITGKLVSAQYWLVNTGSNTRQFSISGLAKGMYFVKLSSGSGSNVIKMNVQ